MTFRTGGSVLIWMAREPLAGPYPDGPYQARFEIDGNVVALLNWSIGGPIPAGPDRKKLREPDPLMVKKDAANKSRPRPIPARGMMAGPRYGESKPPPRPSANRAPEQSGPTIWGMTLITSDANPPRLSFFLQFEAGKGEIKVGADARTKLYVGIGPFGAVMNVIRAMEKDLLLGSRVLSLYEHLEVAVGAALGGGMKKTGDRSGVLKTSIAFSDLRLRNPTHVPVAFVLVDETGAMSNPIRVMVNFRKGYVSANLENDRPPRE
jgi:hypothetical protein